MMPTLRTIPNLIARLSRETGAVAAVEFALIVPFLISLYMGSLEASALFTADKRVNSVSSTVGDLVSQWDADDGLLPSSTVTDYMSAATGIMTPYSTSGIRIVVSVVQVRADGTTKVLWSKANANGTPRAANSSFAPLNSGMMMNSVARGGCIIAAEVSYNYKPLLGAVFKTSLNLAHTNYFLPRYGSIKPITVDTSSGLATDACTA